jgi:hypothetical protein
MRINFALLLVGLLFVESNAFAYKYLCNGMDADGTETVDYCGVCTDDSAPRWIPSSVDVLIDLKTRPKNLNEAEWKSVATESLDTWNKVPGTNLELRFAGEASGRNFGINPKQHEIFWVLDKQEWREKVGSGENGTLGVTVSPYQCPAEGRASREIYDADLIMNGVSKVKWKVDCKEEGRCESIRATLIHELGHFIGIGHPCTDCDWSIMSAASGNAVDRLLQDDQDALRALYPSGQAGQMGMRCDRTEDCKSDLLCIEQSQSTFCSQDCSSKACPSGYTCDRENGAVCRFAMGRLAPPAALRERCDMRPCQEGLQCVATFTDKSFCVKDCLSKSDCPGDEKCILFPDGGAGVCLVSVGLNETCGEFTTCDDKLACVGKNASEGICRPECDPKKTRQCRAGGSCEHIGNDQWACVDNPR